MSSESILSLTFLCLHFVNWKIYLLMSDFQKCYYEQHVNNYSIPHKIWHVQEKSEIVSIFSFFKFWFLIYIQIASNNHNKLMKKLSCTANETVPWYMTYYSEGWHCIAILMISEIRKQHSNVVRLLCVYPFEWHSKVWHLIDPLECHANSWTDRNYRKFLKKH